MLNPDVLRAALLRWFDVHRRDLPWRSMPGEVPDPYRVWLSEVMLQQTRVETVRPYFERWTHQFPTLESLAEANLDDVLKAWEGLGYYSRARNFHTAVKEVQQSYGGKIPDEPERFRELPGVGEYTAGAVMSIAFGRCLPAVDGNVRRVFSRLLDVGDPSAGELRSLATRLADGPRPGDLNQSLMELGATVCTPRNPKCGDCPVEGWCAARAAGTQDSRPARRKRGPLPVEEYGVAAVHREGSFLLRRRAAGTRLGGLWEFPSRLADSAEGVDQAASRVASELGGPNARPGPRLGVVQHDFSHVRAKYHLHLAPIEADHDRPDDVGDPDLRWLPLDRLEEIALPVAQRKLARLIGNHAPALMSS